MKCCVYYFIGKINLVANKSFQRLLGSYIIFFNHFKQDFERNSLSHSKRSKWKYFHMALNYKCKYCNEKQFFRCQPFTSPLPITRKNRGTKKNIMVDLVTKSIKKGKCSTNYLISLIVVVLSSVYIQWTKFLISQYSYNFY